MLKPPCMIVTSMVLPAVRASIARRLIEERGIRPAQVAAKMGVTPAAITQYLTGVRGDRWIRMLESIGLITQQLDGLADDLSRDSVDQSDVIRRLCRICQVVRSQGLICDSHRASLHGLGPEDCGICLASDHIDGTHE